VSGKEGEVEVEVGLQPVSLNPNKRQSRQINLPSLPFPPLPHNPPTPPQKNPTPKSPLDTAKKTIKTKIKPPLLSLHRNVLLEM